MRNGIKILIPDPLAYGVAPLECTFDELECILTKEDMPIKHRDLVRSVWSCQGVGSRSLKSQFGGSIGGMKNSINNKLRPHGIQLLSLPPLPPSAPWRWFLVSTTKGNRE